MSKKIYLFGFSLVEVLIAVFILTFGLLGITGFCINSLQRARNSYWQEIAISQAASLMEKQVSLVQFDFNCRDLLPHGRCEIKTDKVTVYWREKLNEQCCEIKTKSSR